METLQIGKTFQLNSELSLKVKGSSGTYFSKFGPEITFKIESFNSKRIFLSCLNSPHFSDKFKGISITKEQFNSLNS